MTAPVELTADEARRVALWAQGLLGSGYPVTPATAERRGGRARVAAVREVLHHLGAVQLDTISVLARSHELVAYARLGPVGRDAVEEALWGARAPRGDATTFEYWSHAACVLPVEEWPWFAFRRRYFRRRGLRWHDVPAGVEDQVLERLRTDGPLTATELGGAKRGGEWWDWSETKVAVEWLLDTGRVVCARRVGWRRVYDLPERALPPEVLTGPGWTEEDGVAGPPDEECLRRLVGLSGVALGVGTAADLADVHRLQVADVRRHAVDAGLVPVRVAGSGSPAWADPAALAWLSGGGRGRHRTTLLSPFDSLVWHRARTARIFGMEHRLEAYTPAPKRLHGYFAMPVLHRGRLVARVDPARATLGSGRDRTAVLRATRVTLETGRSGAPVPGAVEGTTAALAEAARWVGCAEVTVDEVRPASARAALVAAAGAALAGG
ncbi:MAG: crosslink repair DNA glycosylase YcaQ family protein [Candidatus Nanopelagicales bacterium]